MRTLGAIVVVIAALSGCSAPAASGPAPAAPVTTPVATTATQEATTTMPEPANPVPIMTKIKGCVFGANVKSGELDINGNRFASCELNPKSEDSQAQVMVRTYAGTPPVSAADDSTRFIVGPGFKVSVTGDFGSYSAKVDFQAIASQVGGKLVE